MSLYAKGDVILARIRIGERGMAKIRPVVIMAGSPGGDLLVYPISQSPSWDQPSVPLSPDDFAMGGLDILDDSHILTGQSIRVRTQEVVGKKGSLSGAAMAMLPSVSGNK